MATATTKPKTGRSAGRSSSAPTPSGRTTGAKSTAKSMSRKPKAPVHHVHPLAHLIPAMSEFESFQDRFLFGSMTDFDYLDMAYEGTEVGSEDSTRTMRYNLLIEGHTGSAKTSLIRAWCAKNQRPLITISGNGSLNTDVLIGGPGFDANGTIRPFVPGILVLGMLYGAVVMVDERNYIPPKQFGRFNSMYDSRRTLMLPEAAGSGWCATCGLYNDANRIEEAQRKLILSHINGDGATEVLCEHCGNQFHSDFVVAHKDFFVVDAQNPGYVGTYETNEAARNRYHLILQYDYSEVVESQMLWSTKLIEFASGIRARFGTDINVPLGTNRLLDFESIAINSGFDIACENLVAYFPEEDRGPVRSALGQFASSIREELEAANTSE